MSQTAGTTPRSRTIYPLAALVLVVLAALGYLVLRGGDVPRKPPAEKTASDTATVGTPAAPVGAPEAQPGSADKTTAAATQAPPGKGAGAGGPPPPTFDVVRVSPAGDAVVAGHAAPNSDVQVTVDNGQKVAAKSDARGNFVALFNIEQGHAPRVISLEATTADGRKTASEQTVVVTPPVLPAPQVPQAQVAEAGPEAPPPQSAAQPPGGQPPGRGGHPVLSVTDLPSAPRQGPSVGAGAPADIGSAEVASGAGPRAPAVGAGSADKAAAEPAAPSTPGVLLADRSGVRLLQPPAPPKGPLALSNIVIDAISYDETGDVAISGRATKGDFVRVYVNNRPVHAGEVGPDGSWRAALPQVDQGVYTLRVDQVDKTGKVTSRVETPFKREAPAVLAQAIEAAQRQGQKGVTLVTVQPGYTLWGIARRNYGSGFQYVRIFEANREQIRDPDLIYPGQIFTVPPQGSDAEPAN